MSQPEHIALVLSLGWLALESAGSLARRLRVTRS